VNSRTGPKPHSKAPAGICIVLTPGTAGEVRKVNSIVRSPFIKLTLSAGVPFTVKSLASRVAGSTGSLTSISKTVGGVKMIVSQPALITEQAVGVDVGVAVAVAVGVIVAVAVAVAVGVAVAVAVGVGLAVGVGDGVGVGTPPGAWTRTPIGEPVLKKPTVAFVGLDPWSASNRKLYSVPKRIALAFWLVAKVCVLQVIKSGFVVSTSHGVGL